VIGAVDHLFVVGLASLEDKLVMILDIERLILSSVLGETQAAA
jgi:chemotaxis signal transduction protein